MSYPTDVEFRAVARTGVVGARMLVAATIGAAVIATMVDAASRTRVNPFNFLGYFTIQGNLGLAAAYLLAAIALLRRFPRNDTVVLVRACATGYIVIVGIVYAVLLAPLGAAGGVPVPWANVVLHIVTPIYGLLDWLLIGDRRRLRLSRLWVILIYPALWVAVVLVRGATDGWVPYPFLDPGQGYGVVTAYCAAILVVMLVVGAVVFAISRWTAPVRVLPAPPPAGRQIGD